ATVTADVTVALQTFAGRVKCRKSPARAAAPRSVLPPEPVSVGAAPVGVPLLVLTDQDSEADAGATVALFAKLVKSDDFRLVGALGSGG
ncbi:MAG: hypothetical protein ACLP8B_07280, partial [Xanthobacteraceae bacterium]